MRSRMRRNLTTTTQPTYVRTGDTPDTTTFALISVLSARRTPRAWRLEPPEPVEVYRCKISATGDPVRTCTLPDSRAADATAYRTRKARRA